VTGTLIAPVIPSSTAAAGRPARAPAAARTLPLAVRPALRRPPALGRDVVYGLAHLDRSGRVADRAVTGALDLLCLDQPIDTTTPQGKLFFTILAAFAEFERDLIRERTKDGLAATTARGRNGGRKHRLTEEQKVTARKLRADGHSIRDIGQLLGNGKPVSRQTVYRALGMLSA